MKKLMENIWTFILMSLPIGLYIWILRKHPKACERLQNYAGIIGNNPMSYGVYHGIVLVDLNNLQI